jgi:riboflavin kinase/FMN adenylyltransferase
VLIIEDFSTCPWPGLSSIVTIGAFDGLHIGHRTIIGQVVEQAKESEQRRSVLVTFDRHPASLVRPESAPKLLSTHEHKIELLAETGLDATAVITFDETQAAESPEEFVERVLVNCLRAEKVVVGEDFHFGRGRSGNVELLRRVGELHGFSVQPIELVSTGDTVTSSTAIRSAIASGDVESAGVMLDRPFEVRGVVRRGDARGRTIGFPTANVEVSMKYAQPAEGVYAAWYVRELSDGSTVSLPAAVNVGRRPTFYEHAPMALIEAHVIDGENLDLYDEQARLQFVARLRAERKFDSLEDLKHQLQIDIDEARRLLSDQTRS